MGTSLDLSGCCSGWMWRPRETQWARLWRKLVRSVCVERLDSVYKGSVGRTRSKFDFLDNWLKLCLFTRKKRLNLFMSVN